MMMMMMMSTQSSSLATVVVRGTSSAATDSTESSWADDTPAEEERHRRRRMVMDATVAFWIPKSKKEEREYEQPNHQRQSLDLMAVFGWSISIYTIMYCGGWLSRSLGGGSITGTSEYGMIMIWKTKRTNSVTYNCHIHVSHTASTYVTSAYHIQ
jgi:hypothetical protein